LFIGDIIAGDIPPVGGIIMGGILFIDGIIAGGMLFIDGIMGIVGAKPYWGWAIIGYCMVLLSSICQAGGIAETHEIEPITEGIAGLGNGEAWAAS
jgi:hypothetical protein